MLSSILWKPIVPLAILHPVFPEVLGPLRSVPVPISQHVVVLLEVEELILYLIYTALCVFPSSKLMVIVDQWPVDPYP
jgi:hypothetical protein